LPEGKRGHDSKLEAQHELQLPGQPCPGIGRRRVVIVGIEVHKRADYSKIWFVAESAHLPGSGRGIVEDGRSS